MKTTEQIHQLYEMNNEGERDIAKDKWYSEEELRKIICYQKIDKDRGLVDGLSNRDIKYLLKRLFEDNTPDLNSRSSDEDSLNKDLTENQK